MKQVDDSQEAAKYYKRMREYTTQPTVSKESEDIDLQLMEEVGPLIVSLFRWLSFFLESLAFLFRVHCLSAVGVAVGGRG